MNNKVYFNALEHSKNKNQIDNGDFIFEGIFMFHDLFVSKKHINPEDLCDLNETLEKKQVVNIRV